LLFLWSLASGLILTTMIIFPFLHFFAFAREKQRWERDGFIVDPFIPQNPVYQATESN